MANDEITTNEIMEFLQEHVATKEDIANFVTKDDLKDFATKDDIKNLRIEMGRIEHRILDTMDDKLTDLKGDLVVLMRKEDTKLVELVEILRDKDVISKEEAGKILGMQPFPQLTH